MEENSAKSAKEVSFMLMKINVWIKENENVWNIMDRCKEYDHVLIKKAILNYYISPKIRNECSPELEAWAVELNDRNALTKIIENYYSNGRGDVSIGKAFDLSQKFRIHEEFFTVEHFKNEYLKVKAFISEAHNCGGGAVFRRILAIANIIGGESREIVLRDSRVNSMQPENQYWITLLEGTCSWPEMQLEKYADLKKNAVHRIYSLDVNFREGNPVQKILHGIEYGNHLLKILSSDNSEWVLPIITDNYRKHGTPKLLRKLAKICIKFKHEKMAKEVFDEAYDAEMLKIIEKELEEK